MSATISPPDLTRSTKSRSAASEPSLAATRRVTTVPAASDAAKVKVRVVGLKVMSEPDAGTLVRTLPLPTREAV